jgi:ferredoxin
MVSEQQTNPDDEAPDQAADTADELVVDSSRCMGAGQCVLTAPDLFDQSEEEGTVLLVREPRDDETDRSLVRRAVDLCPSGAVSFASRSRRPLT